jgi:hypothetical protein
VYQGLTALHTLHAFLQYDLCTFFLTPSCWLDSFNNTGGRNFDIALCNCSSDSAEPMRRNTRSKRAEN